MEKVNNIFNTYDINNLKNCYLAKESGEMNISDANIFEKNSMN